jgi:outer membrane lipoprotein SlyB
MKLNRVLLLCLAAAVVGGCATMPSGPSVMVLPEPGKSFEEFQSDDVICRQWAKERIEISPSETVNKNLAGGAAVGTAMGAALGAAIGAASGKPATGAAIGASSGLVGGTAAASGPAYAAGHEAQRRYDNAYQQCMYAKGNQIPRAVAAPSPRSRLIPPPPHSGGEAPYYPSRISKIPPDHMPPPGKCRIWYPDLPPGHQPPPGECVDLQYRVPPGAWLIGG